MHLKLQGKGWFIWQLPRCEGGVPAALAAKAAAAGVTHILIKIAERTYGFGFDRSGRDLVPPVVDALRANGIQVWGWHYVYGENPVGEANIAIQRTVQLGLDGYVIDAEAEYKMPGKEAAARTFMTALRSGLPNTPIALSSYRYPSLHPQLPWRAFLEYCDLSMPQVYWEQAHNPDQQLTRSVTEFSNAARVGFVRPIVPTGAAYGVGGWRSMPEDIHKFYAQALNLGLPAANLYSWDYATSPGNTDLWEAAAQFNWPISPAPPANIAQRYIAALNSGEPGKVTTLYHSNAGHVTAKRTIIGIETIRQWYEELLHNILPGAQFQLLESSGVENSQQIRWTAAGPTGQVQDGRDTLGLRNGLIQYHYTHFTVIPPPG